MTNSTEDRPIKAPKVFISYAQSEERTAWVKEICERLLHDGVDVVADLYELPHGADIHAFMERCVNDPTITRVLMLCDRLYCDKANGRLGGVGKETQIISAEVYARVIETKFLPIFCEVSEDGNPLLPTYLKSRLGIDFSSSDKVNENWETLVRDLFGQPLYQKPPLGQMPAYITTPQQPSRTAASKFLSWRQAVHRNSSRAPLLFQQYVEALTHELRELYLTQTQVEELETEFEEKLQRWIPIHDELLEAFGFWAGEPPSKAAENIGSVLERLLPFKFAPDPLPQGGWPTIATDGLAVFLYELFLRTVGTLLSLNAHETLAALLQRLYVVPTHERSSWGNMARFTIFWTYSKILENKKNVRRLDRYDLLADIMKERCGTSASVFQSLMEADLPLALRSILHTYSYLWWYPRTLIYSSQRVLPLFARAEQHQQFGVLCKLIGVTDKQELQGLFLAAVEKDPSVKTLYLNSFSPASLAALINFDRLDTVA